MKLNRRSVLATLLTFFSGPWSPPPYRAFRVESRGYQFWYSARSAAEAAAMHSEEGEEPIDDLRDVTSDLPFTIIDEEDGTERTMTLREWGASEAGLFATDCF